MERFTGIEPFAATVATSGLIKSTLTLELILSITASISPPRLNVSGSVSNSEVLQIKVSTPELVIVRVCVEVSPENRASLIDVGATKMVGAQNSFHP